MNEKEIVVSNWFRKGDNDLRAAEIIVDPVFMEWEEICRSLTVYVIDPRYPNSSYECSNEEAEGAFSSAARIRDFVRSKVRLGDN